MTQVIYRFKVPNEIKLINSDKIVKFAFQPVRGVYSVWICTFPERDKYSGKTFKFEVVPTGELFDGEHVMSLVMPDDFRIFHLIKKEIR